MNPSDVDTIVVHCSGTDNTKDITSYDIDAMHKSIGWDGCGYHFVIRLNGDIESYSKGFPTRPLNKIGAHVGGCGKGWNQRSLGICLVGGVDSDNKSLEDSFTPLQYESLKSLLKDLEVDYPNCEILGHRDLIKRTNSSPKDCPCFDVKSWLESWLESC